jgi:hypothetical protein
LFERLCILALITEAQHQAKPVYNVKIIIVYKMLYKLNKQSSFLSLVITPSGWSFLLTENCYQYLKLFIPILVYLFFILPLTIVNLLNSITSASPNDTGSGSLLFAAIFASILLWTPLFYFIFSVRTAERLLVTRTFISINKYFFGKLFFSRTIPIQNIRKIEIDCLSEIASSRGTSDYIMNEPSNRWITACKIYTSKEEFIFGFWLSLRDQGILVSEIRNFLQS